MRNTEMNDAETKGNKHWEDCPRGQRGAIGCSEKTRERRQRRILVEYGERAERELAEKAEPR
jgi:hypothetical protein